MFNLLKKHIAARVSLTDEEFETCCSYFVPKNLKKHQFFLMEGEVCKQIAFVTKGCLRAYSVDARGVEHVLQFAIEDWWISDPLSFLTGAPSTYTIDVLEDSSVLLLDKPAREEMMIAVPMMERVFRLLQEAHLVATHRRITESLSLSAEERYTRFLETYPKLTERISQGQIASYLGITPQSLSRIRKDRSRKA